jgi:hypothetical protein
MSGYPCRTVEVLLVRAEAIASNLSADHPARELAIYLLKYNSNLSIANRDWLRTFTSARSRLRTEYILSHCQDFDTFIASLPGSVSLQTLDDGSRYPLSFHGQGVVTFTWVAPWARRLLKSGSVQYFELDASFYAIRPYVYVVPFAVVANYGFPLGLAVAPTERTEIYQLFDQAISVREIGVGLCQTKPILSDQGKALMAYCTGYESSHYFCFRHLLELLGSHTYVAMLGRRLFFTGSRAEYTELKRITVIDFAIGCKEGAISAKGAQHFCDFFGLSLSEDMNVIMNPIDPFLGQALWSNRGSGGVATCTNHSEGFHGRANRKVAGVRCLVRRIATVVDMLIKKHQQFSLAKVNRSPKALLEKLVKSARLEQLNGSLKTYTRDHGCPEHCGWDIIYSRRFMIPNFPCRHMALDPSLQIEWDRGLNCGLDGDLNDAHTIVAIPYTGREWPFALAKPRKGFGRDMEEPDDSLAGSDVESFIRRLHKELCIAFPHVQIKSKMMLSVEFGRFIQASSPAQDAMNDLQLRSLFQLHSFRVSSSN